MAAIGPRGKKEKRLDTFLSYFLVFIAGGLYFCWVNDLHGLHAQLAQDEAALHTQDQFRTNLNYDQPSQEALTSLSGTLGHIEYQKPHLAATSHPERPEKASKRHSPAHSAVDKEKAETAGLNLGGLAQARIDHQN